MKKHNKKSEIKEGISKGIFGGFLSSLCCVGPLIIVLLGLGSVSFALSMGQYRPYFLGLGILFIILAVGLHLNKKNKTCSINCFSAEGIKREKTFIISLVLSMVIIYFLALYVLVPAISPMIYSNAVAKEQQTNQKAIGEVENSNIALNENLNKLNLKINGMTCTGCASGIQSILLSFEGVIDAKISYQDRTGEVIYNPSIITKEEIINSEAFTGQYSAEIISDEKFDE